MQGIRVAALAVLYLGFGAGGSPSTLWGQEYDLVLRGGRVMDPASGLDGVRDDASRTGASGRSRRLRWRTG
jgi:hypothetical protein